LAAKDPPGAIPLDDRGLLLSDGLFETLLFAGGELVLGEAHARRMSDGAAVLALPAPTATDFVGCALAAVRGAGFAQARAAVRVTLTAGSGGRGLGRPVAPEPRLFATAAPTIRPHSAASLFVAQIRRNQTSPASRLKTLAYLDNVLARQEAVVAGADEAVMLNTLGEVACAAGANLFWLKDGVLFTPARETGRLDGVMARQVIAVAAKMEIETRLVREGPEALHGADALFLTHSLIGVRSAYMGGQGPPAPNALVQRLSEAISQFV
jgi:branched-subunit amino acid aminotransferase/4-amino-4-deoxychorismate lyase